MYMFHYISATVSGGPDSIGPTYLFGRTGKSGFGYRTTAEQVTNGIYVDSDVTELTAIVTGATSGIGTETVRVLALRGAHVYIAGRTVESATATKESILNELPNAKLGILAPLDLSSQASIRKCAERFLALDRPLNLLINNAGIMMGRYELTEDGIESNFGINHIGHFLLTNLLLEKLKETANRTGIESRIINLSSSSILFANKSSVTWDHINEREGYKPMKAYGLSKIAALYHAQELTRRLQEEGVTNVTINAVHPGLIMTNLLRNSKIAFRLVYAITFVIWKTIPQWPHWTVTSWKNCLDMAEWYISVQGAATTCYVALLPNVKGVSGKYFCDCNEYRATSYTKLAEDEEASRKLWDVSVQLTGT